ncbi:hypothetical protein [Pseudofulvibacter geojedonensis]|uniref:Outer membrane protein beta-barrel domain-containing protein n=1 Tax=Pseudofulvibacter geojedonensis TaxID=1123758 RepID=A0ABW3I3Q4_9FLAO
MNSIIEQKKNTFLNRQIEPSWFISSSISFPFKEFNIGLEARYTSRYKYHSSALYWQQKQITPNDLLITSTGEYHQQATIQHSSLNAISEINIYTLNFSNQSTMKFRIGLGSGLSLYQVKASIPYAFLHLKFKKELGLEDHYILGPGSVKSEKSNSFAFNYQIYGSIKLRFKKTFSLSIGFRINNLGHFIMMKRPIGKEEFFAINANYTNNNNNTQEKLSLNTTNNKQYIISKELFLRFYF